MKADMYVSENYLGHLLIEFSRGTCIWYEIGTEVNGIVKFTHQNFATKDLAKAHIREFLIDKPEEPESQESFMHCIKCKTQYRVTDELAEEPKYKVTHWLFSQYCNKCKSTFINFIRLLN